MKKLLVANWKMNHDLAQCEDFFKTFNETYSGTSEAWVAPQAIHLQKVLELGSGKIKVGAQNCSEHVSGAYTGELSPRSLKDLGAHFVILGHSERRQYFQESSRLLNNKIKAALAEGLAVIYCVGETLEEREANSTLSVIEGQLQEGLTELNQANAENLIIAYEPVWAIGTGKTATPEQAQEVHAKIRDYLSQRFPSFGKSIRLLYGGSVKPENVDSLLGQSDIDGGLVGGASLKAKDFLALCGDK